MKKNFAILVAAVLIVGIFSVTSYIKFTSPVEKDFSILTPDSEEIEFADGMVIIDDLDVPLSDGPGTLSSEAAAQVSVDPYVQKIVELVNEERAKAGVAPLELDMQICDAAAIRAEEIYSVFAHERPDGSRYRTVLDQCNIPYSFCGENVAYGYRSPDAVMDGWMNSEGHKANILNERFTKIGVGHYKGSNGYDYWSQLFTN